MSLLHIINPQFTASFTVRYYTTTQHNTWKPRRRERHSGGIHER